MKCGCRVEACYGRDDGGTVVKDAAGIPVGLKWAIVFCPLHACAEEMLRFLKARLNRAAICYSREKCTDYHNLIRRAEGKP